MHLTRILRVGFIGGVTPCAATLGMRRAPPNDMSNLVEVSSERPLAATPTKARSRRRDPKSVRQILVCVDRSRFSSVCLRDAVAISRCLGGAITLLHVIPTTARRTGQAIDALDWELARQEAAAYLTRLQGEGALASASPVATRLEEGHPAERIVAVARELDADLTIICGQGERRAADAGLGSTAHQVLAAVEGSVFLARTSRATADVSALKHILVPLDGSLRAESVLPAAVRIANELGAEIHLVFAVQEPLPTAVLSAPADLVVARDLASRMESSGKQYLDGLCEQLVRDGSKARASVLRSPDERKAILELSRREPTDLIVLSAHGSTCNPEVTCGSVTTSLLANATAPLLVLQDLRGQGLRDSSKEHPSAPPLRASCAEEV